MATDPRKIDPATGLPIPAPAGFPLVGAPAALPMLTAGTPPIPQTAQVRANSFGDAAAAAANPAVQTVAPLTGAAPVAGFPSQFLTTPGAGRGAVNPAAVTPVAAAPVATAAPSGYVDPMGTAVGGIDTSANRAVDPNGPRGFLDIVAAGFGGNTAAPAAAPAVTPAAVASVAKPPAAITPNTGSPDVGSPTAEEVAGVAPGAAAAATGLPAGVTRTGNSFSGVNVAAPAGTPAYDTNALGGGADTAARLASLQASNAAVPRGGLSVFDNGGADRNAAFNEGAALRSAATRTTFSPKRGYQGDEAALTAALAPINNRARSGDVAANIAGQAATTAAREAGDTTRLGMREAGDNARAAVTGARDQQRLDLERRGFGLKEQSAVLDNAAKQRIEIVQKEIQDAKTPEARRAAAEKLAALNGKERANRFKAIEVGGGQVVDPATGVATQQPKSVVVYDEATGQVQTSTPGAAAAAKPAVAEGSTSTSGGKPIRFTNGKWVPA